MNINSIVRRLCPLEAGRLMHFPENYLAIDGKDTPDSPQFKAAGNSWGVNNAEWVNIRTEKVLRETGLVSGGRTIQYATTCSGIEAHTLSVKGKNWHANFFSEIENFPCRLLAHYYPDVPNLGDMTKVDGHGYSLDVFSGGTPCQSFSTAGKRHGLGGSTDWTDTPTRSSLVFHWVRLGLETKAQILLWENVAGVLSSSEGRDFPWLLHFLNDMGYAVAWRTMDMQWIATDTAPRAVPQRRRRIWLIAYEGDDWRIPARILFERTSALGTLHPNRVVNGRVIRSEEDEAEAALDLFGGAEPAFNSSSRTDWIPFSAMPGNGSDFLTLSDISLVEFFRKIGRIGYVGGIFKGAPDPANIPANLRENIGNAGCAVKDRIVTLKMPEWSAGIQLPDGVECPKEYDGTVCGLTDVLLPMSDELMGYILSPRACTGILRRAEMRGKKLPPPLERALHEQIAHWANGTFGDAVAADAKDEEAEAEGATADGDGSLVSQDEE